MIFAQNPYAFENITDVFCFGEELKNSGDFFCCITIRQSKIIDKIKIHSL